MIKFLQRINKKYDRIKEPKRFLVFIGMMMPALFAQAIGEHYEVIWLFSGSWIYMLIMLTIRVLYMNGAFKSE